MHAALRRLVFIVPILCLEMYALGTPPPESGYHLVKKNSFGAAPGGGEYFSQPQGLFVF
jgi:hypothetical protein